MQEKKKKCRGVVCRSKTGAYAVKLIKEKMKKKIGPVDLGLFTKEPDRLRKSGINRTLQNIFVISCFSPPSKNRIPLPSLYLNSFSVSTKQLRRGGRPPKGGGAAVGASKISKLFFYKR